MKGTNLTQQAENWSWNVLKLELEMKIDLQNGVVGFAEINLKKNENLELFISEIRKYATKNSS